MKLRKLALRGLVAVAVGAALCMFFSGTIENITTPKVKTVRASRGKFALQLELAAELAYPEVEEQRMTLPAGQTLTIMRVNVRAGYPVSKGDVLLEATVTDCKAAERQAQADYDAALDACMEVERKNEGLVLRRSEQIYADAYAALRMAAREAAQKRTAVDVLLKEAELNYTEVGYPSGAGEVLCAAIDDYRETLAVQDAAQAEFDRAARYGVSDAAWNYISELQSAQEKLDDCAEALVELEELKHAAAQICAPHDGVIAAIELKAGDGYDGGAPLYAITAEGSAPALRIDLNDVDRPVFEGMEVILPKGTEAKVTGLGFTNAGARCADAAVTEEIVRDESSIYELAMNGTKVFLCFAARENSSLLPASAVRGSGDARYIYVVNERETGLGKKKRSLSKMSVTVVDEGGGTASIQEDLSGLDVAYMEDRALLDGADVMYYAQ